MSLRCLKETEGHTLITAGFLTRGWDTVGGNTEKSASQRRTQAAAHAGAQAGLTMCVLHLSLLRSASASLLEALGLLSSATTKCVQSLLRLVQYLQSAQYTIVEQDVEAQ